MAIKNGSPAIFTASNAQQVQLNANNPSLNFIFLGVQKRSMILFYLPHMEYEGSIGLVSRKMKIFFR
jgi:hypothetical protein